ncbi:hypothetical protein GCM10009557_54490 [Virgisporangium ochraceum]
MAWRLRIRHVTGFTYEGQAHTSYNEARLTPMTLPWQVTLFSQVEVHPAASLYRYYDYWGTLVTAFDLQRQHGELKVVASSLVETDTPAPVVSADWSVLAAAADEHAELLAATPRTTVDPSVLPSFDGSPSDVALEIASFVRSHVEYVPGSTGVQTSAQEAWTLRKGVCQDIAQLTVALLRQRGIPARYVSGYLHPKREAEIGQTVEGQSHAWVEWWWRPRLRRRTAAEGRLPRPAVEPPRRPGGDHEGHVAPRRLRQFPADLALVASLISRYIGLYTGPQLQDRRLRLRPGAGAAGVSRRRWGAGGSPGGRPRSGSGRAPR